MTERLIDRIDQTCWKRRAGLHQNRCKDGETEIEQHEKVEQGQIMPGYPKHDAVAAAESLAALNTVVMVFASKLIQLTAAIRKGMASPAEYAESSETPVETEPPFRESVRMEPNTGPTHGAQPAEKNTPIIAEER